MVSERIGRPLEARVLREERELRLSLAPVELPT
jgi:hypothetical protein